MYVLPASSTVGLLTLHVVRKPPRGAYVFIPINNKQIMKKKLLLIFWVAAFVSSCGKEEMQKPESKVFDNYGNYTEQFMDIWSTMNSNYSMWALESIDWDVMYNNGLKVVEAWDRATDKSSITDDVFAEFYQNLLGGLHDHHMYVTIKHITTGTTIYISPARLRNLSRDDWREPLGTERFMAMTQKYIADGVIKNAALAEYVAEGHSNYVCTGLIDKNILYFRLSKFSLTSVIDTNENVMNVIKHFIGFQKGELSAVILDLRDNGGGFDNDNKYILGTLIDEPLKVGYYRSKDGAGRNDMTDLQPSYINPGIEHHYLGKNVPIVALVDINSISNGEFTPLAIKELPDGNGIVAGERTFGALGCISDSKVDYTGGIASSNNTFDIFNATGIHYDNDGNCYESVGVTPTDGWSVRFDPEAWDNGVDNMLEFVINKLKNN